MKGFTFEMLLTPPNTSIPSSELLTLWMWDSVVPLPIASVVSAFYYLRIVKVMFFDDPVVRVPEQMQCPIQNSILSANGLAVIALGIVPGPLMAWCVLAVRSSLGA